MGVLQRTRKGLLSIANLRFSLQWCRIHLPTSEQIFFYPHLHYSVLCLLKEEVGLNMGVQILLLQNYLTVSVQGHAGHFYLHDYLLHGIQLH